VATVARAVDAGLQPNPLLRLDTQGQASATGVLVLDVAAGEGVLDVAVMGAPGAAGPDRGLAVGERRVDDARAFQPAVVASRQLGGGVEAIENGLVGDDIDRPTDDVAAKERALRPLENLDALDVERVEGHGGGTAQIDFVEEDGRAGIAGGAAVRGADAADRDSWLRGGKGVELQAGCQAGHIVDLADPGLLDLIGPEGGDGDGNLLQALASPLGGDDHLLDLGDLRRGGRLSERW